MAKFILKRLVGSLFTIYVIMTLSFFLMRLAPGGPFDQERVLPPDIMKNIEAKYHLDEPILQQYWRYISNVAFHLDFGPSYKYPDRTVNELIGLGLPSTIRLGAYALLVSIIVGVITGIIAALKHNSRWDYAAMAFAMVGVSIPNFVLAPLAQLFFGIKLNLLPVAGWDSYAHYILPSITLGLMYAASMARLTRGGMLEVTRQDYIRTARAKGLSERLVILRHMLRGGLLPVVTYLGPATAALLSGSLVIEKIFDIPGVGRHFVNAAINRDYTMALGMVIFFSVLIIFLNLVVDIAYVFIDPRIREK